MKVGVKKLLRAGMMPARARGIRAVEMSPTERLKLRRQKAAAASEKSTTSLSFFMEAYGLETFHGRSVLGRRSLEWKMAARTKRSVDETNSRSFLSDVETGERTFRSGDV